LTLLQKRLFSTFDKFCQSSNYKLSFVANFNFERIAHFMGRIPDGKKREKCGSVNNWRNMVDTEKETTQLQI
jgi:hypothetical protein